MTRPSPRPRSQSCHVPGCLVTDDLVRGLCVPHGDTHRGLADPAVDAPPFDAADHPEVAFP